MQCKTIIRQLKIVHSRMQVSCTLWMKQMAQGVTRRKPPYISDATNHVYTSKTSKSMQDAWTRSRRQVFVQPTIKSTRCAGSRAICPPPLRTVRSSSSPYTPYTFGAQHALLPVAVGAMNIHDVRDRQTDDRQTSDSIIA